MARDQKVENLFLNVAQLEKNIRRNRTLYGPRFNKGSHQRAAQTMQAKSAKLKKNIFGRPARLSPFSMTYLRKVNDKLANILTNLQHS
jgi:hypothetical protein